MTESNATVTFGAAMLASALAEIATLPTDIAKVRLQVQVSSGKMGSSHYNGMVDCIKKISKEEGPKALWKGWQPALLRQCCYSTLAMVLYEQLTLNLYGDMKKEDMGYFQRLISGGTAGALSIFVFNWTEVLKTQMQTNSSSNVSMRSVFSKIYASEGLFSFLFSGVKPNIMRTFLVNAAELGSYDHAKTMFFVPIVGDNAFAHLLSSGFAGVASALVSTPADVIKTRMMNNAGSGSSILPSNNQKAKGIVQVFTQIRKHEGMSALYKGFVPICVRKVIWCSVFFVSFEQIKKSLLPS